MYVTNITDDYDNITSGTYAVYDNISFASCTIIEINVDIIIPTLLLKIPYGISILWMISFMVYTIIKHFFNSE